MGRRLKMLEPVLDPLYRPAEHPASMAHRDFLGIGSGFGAEAAADILGDHANGVFRQVQQPGQILPDGVVGLGRSIERQEIPAGIEIGDAAAVFERHRRLAPKFEFPGNPPGAAGERGIGIAGLVPEGRCDIARPVGVQGRRILRQGCRGRGDGRQGPVIDLDKGREVFCFVAAFRHDEGHRLADEAHPPARQEWHHGMPHARMRIAQDQRFFDERQIFGGQHQQGPGLERRAGVDSADARMGDRAAHEGGMRHPVQPDVVGEAGPACEQALVFPAPPARRSALSGHRHRTRSPPVSGATAAPLAVQLGFIDERPLLRCPFRPTDSTASGGQAV